MSFDHMLVSTLLEQHKWQMEYVRGHLETTSDEQQRIVAASVREVDGIPLHRDLAEFCEEVRKVARGVKFAVERGGKATWRNGVCAMGEVWLYYPEDRYAFMRLGYADYSVNSGTNNKYAVYSRNIQNEKFHRNRDQYHMVLTETLDRAVKNAKKYMRRYDVNETANMALDEISVHLSRASRQVASAYVAARETVIEHVAFFSEMRSLVMNNYQFNNPAFGAVLKTMVDKLDEYAAKQNEQHHGYYVQVRDYLGEQVFDVIPVTDVHKTNGKFMNAHTGLKSDELVALDENLPSRLAALSMLEDNTFVEGLGQKISATSYWVLHVR